MRETLERVADTAFEGRDRRRDPLVLLIGFGDNSVNWDVSLWIDDPWFARRAISQLHIAVWDALKAEGIVIAFPQLDVHFDPPVVESLQRLRPAG